MKPAPSAVPALAPRWWGGARWQNANEDDTGLKAVFICSECGFKLLRTRTGGEGSSSRRQNGSVPGPATEDGRPAGRSMSADGATNITSIARHSPQAAAALRAAPNCLLVNTQQQINYSGLISSCHTAKRASSIFCSGRNSALCSSVIQR